MHFLSYVFSLSRWLQDLLCGACKAKSRRLVKYTGVTITELNAPPEPPTPPKAASTKSKSKGKKEPAPVNESIWSRPAGHEQDEDDSKPWSFKCKCGEVCSSYENPLYHPKGQWFECSQCSVWSHVLCLLGNLTPEQVLEMKVSTLLILRMIRDELVPVTSSYFVLCVNVLCFRRRCASAARPRTGAAAAAEGWQHRTPTSA